MGDVIGNCVRALISLTSVKNSEKCEYEKRNFFSEPIIHESAKRRPDCKIRREIRVMMSQLIHNFRCY